jgi:hypothetical protein
VNAIYIEILQRKTPYFGLFSLCMHRLSAIKLRRPGSGEAARLNAGNKPDKKVAAAPDGSATFAQRRCER